MYIKYLIIFGTIMSFSLFSCGIFFLSRQNEPNLCQMTYMFQDPQFTPVLKENEEFPSYGLFYYNEGFYMGDIMNLNGAPVLFLPGNGGSYKQVRSLGSVALRMGVGYNKQHLDYFTIDYAEELSALFGSYLEREKRFMELSIEAILKLYKEDDTKYKRKITIIGHSMGGVLAKSILKDEKWLKKVGIIISISSPLDRPVVYMDYELDSFYQQTEEILLNNNDNKKTSLSLENYTTKTPNVVFISIGGGNRDSLVPATLTESKLSDVHAMSTSIPNVWVTCDHLSVLWCLQLVKVINKYLYGIIFKGAYGFSFFSTNTALNLQMAKNYFIGYHTEQVHREPTEFDFETWISTKSTNLSIVFENGIDEIYQQAVILENVTPYEQIYISVIHEIGNQWLFGCEHRNCVQNQVLTEHVYQLPSKRGHKSYALLNLPAIFGTFNNWTHLLIKLPITRKYASLYIDISNVEDRLKTIKESTSFNIQTETVYQQLQVEGLTDSFYAFELSLPLLSCKKNVEAIAKIYAPWAKGFDRYYIMNPTTAGKHILINLPKNYRMDELNITKSTLFVDLHYDPWCNLSIDYQFSATNSLRNFVLQYFQWIPAHMALILITNLGRQFKNPSAGFNFFVQNKSWYIVVILHFQFTFLTKLANLPDDLKPLTNVSIYASLIIHGFAMACCFLISVVQHISLKISIKIAEKVPHFSKWDMTLVILSAIIATTCCKSLILMLMYLFYFGFVGFGVKNANNLDRIQNEQETSTTNNEQDDKDEQENEVVLIAPKTGFRNLSYHITLISLILLLIIVNAGDSIAWIKSNMTDTPYVSTNFTTTLLFTPSMFVVYILPLLWHLKAPKQVVESSKFAQILKALAIASLIFCGEKLYRLNYVIPLVFILLVSKEYLSTTEN